jgi:hypothetical protein
MRNVKTDKGDVNVCNGSFFGMKSRFIVGGGGLGVGEECEHETWVKNLL